MVGQHENTKVLGGARCTARRRWNAQQIVQTSDAQIRHCMLSVLVARYREIRNSIFFSPVRARGIRHFAQRGHRHRLDQTMTANTETAESIDYSDVSYVVSSDYRIAIIKALDDGESTPSRIADKTGIDITHASRSLKDLTGKGLVDLKVEEATKKGRIYGLTEDGRAIIPKVREVAGE